MAGEGRSKHIQNPLLTRYLAYPIILIGAVLAIKSPTPLLWIAIGLSSLVALLGVMLFLGSSLAFVVIQDCHPRESGDPDKKTFKTMDSRESGNDEREFSLFQARSYLFAGQLILMIITIAFFRLLEVQTQLNPRLQPLESGHLLQMLKSNILSLGLFPWMLYSVLGVGVAYFSICLKRTPYLPKVIVPNHRKQPQLFMHNFLCTVTEAVTTYPVIFITSLVLICVCEGYSTVYQRNSFFATPILTLPILGILILVLGRVNATLMDWMARHQIGIGKIIVVYISTLSILLLGLHELGEAWFLRHNTSPTVVVKSVLVGSFKESELQTRLTFLIWGWWGVWVPWMTSFVARLSIGSVVWKAIVQAMIIPGMVFFFVFYGATTEYWTVLCRALQNPIALFLMAFGLLLLIWCVLGRMRTTADISRGFMISQGKWWHQPVKNWMKGLMLWLTCFIPGWFSMGWVPIQVTATFGSIFITVLSICFLRTLFLAIWPAPVPALEPLAVGGTAVLGSGASPTALPITVETNKKEVEKLLVVRPYDRVELTLKEIWMSVLKISRIGIFDDLFTLGGDSLELIFLANEVNEKFKTQFPLAWLVEHRTIRAQALAIRKAGSLPVYSPVVRFINVNVNVNVNANINSLSLSKETKQTPLVFIHSALSGAEVYETFAHLLPKNIPFSAIDSYNLNSGETNITTIEALATHYITYLRTIKSEGPYLLGGWSLGGMVAYEMAQQLTKLGERVDKVYLLDSHVLIQGFLQTMADAVTVEELFDAVPHQWSEYLRTLPPAYMNKVFHSFRTEIQMMSRYVVKPYSGSVMLFKSTKLTKLDKYFKNFMHNGWKPFIKNLGIKPIYSDHIDLVEGECIKEIATLIGSDYQRCIEL